MNKREMILILCIIFILSAARSQLNVERQGLPTAITDAGFTVSLTIKPENTTTFDVAEMIPTDWSIINWAVSGNNSRVRYEVLSVPYRNEQKSANHWRFANESSDKITLTYMVTPKQGFIGFQTLVYVYTYPGGFDAKEYTLFVSGTVFKTAVCGNGICEILFGETSETCPQDCNIKTDSLTIFVLVMSALIISSIVYLIKRRQKPINYGTITTKEVILEAQATIPKEKLRHKKPKPKTYYSETVNWFEKLKKSLK